MFGDRAQGGNERERFEEGLVLEEFAGAVGIERVHAAGLLRIADAVRHHHRVVPGLLGGAREGGIERRAGHRLGVGEAHGTSGLWALRWLGARLVGRSAGGALRWRDTPLAGRSAGWALGRRDAGIPLIVAG